MKQYDKGTTVTLKDGRIFNSRFSRPDYAVADVSDYLYCEYGEAITADDVASVEAE